MRRRSCGICDCTLYDDEPGAWCVDCREVYRRCAEGWQHELPKNDPDCIARVEAHTERVQRELAELKESSC